MIHKPIYPPKARAREYGDLAINIYRGCNHGCTYCFAPGVLRMSREAFCKVGLRPGIVESVKRQIEREKITGKLIHLCFTCDPYPAEINTTPTQEIIKAIKDSGNAVQILTKGGERAERDFFLLDSFDWFGVTFTTSATDIDSREPYAAPAFERLSSLQIAKWRGIQTWVSCEPVIDPVAVFTLIETAHYIDLFRIGKLNLNHRNTTPELKAIHDGIKWAEFGAKCVELCEAHGRAYYIKDDLRAEMEGGGL